MVKPKLSPAYPDRAPWGTSVHLRAWQAEAMQKYFEKNPRDFMAVATPGAGKPSRSPSPRNSSTAARCASSSLWRRPTT